MGSPLGLTFKNEASGLQSTTNNGTKTYRVVDGKAVKSLFDSGQFSPYPSSFTPSSGSVDKMKDAFDVHGDDANDISISSIIKYCNKHTSMKLDYAHFAYLRNLGVYPNNRLIIARRFSAGVGNDLTAIPGTPLATIVSYLSDQEDLFTMTFNEQWTDAEASFEEVLNDIGDDILGGDNVGGKLGTEAKGYFNIIPLGGMMEGVQLEVMKKMGLVGEDQGFGNSPRGNPNLVKQARQRDIPDKGRAGSSLAAKFTIKLVVEYEQKFINGVDPTLVYMDILQNALTFGTSDAFFMYNSALAQGTAGIIKNLISGDVNAIGQAITEFVNALVSAITSVVTEIAKGLIEALENKDKQGDKPDEKKLVEIAKQGILSLFTTAALGTVISKYKVRLMGIANALTGSPSTPWHVTIGNPKKPIFSSGDMECTEVQLTLGKTLAFNDLPSTIKLEISLTNARSLGASEIFNRFNTGKGRSYVRLNKSFNEVNNSVIDDTTKKKVEEKNKDNNAETQTPPPLTTPASSTDANNPNNNKVTDTQQKNQQTPDQQKSVPDSYLVSFSDPNGGTPWGVKQPVTPEVKTGDNTTVGLSSSVGTKGSGQNPNSPITPTSGVSLASDASAIPPSTLIPGIQPPVSTNGLPVGIAAPEFLQPGAVGVPPALQPPFSPLVVLPTNPESGATPSSEIKPTEKSLIEAARNSFLTLPTDPRFVPVGSSPSPPQPQNTTSLPPGAAAEAWERGKRVNRGSFNEENIKVTWEVKQGDFPGAYDLSWSGSGGTFGSYYVGLTGKTQSQINAGKEMFPDSDEWSVINTLEYATNMVKEEAFIEFEYRKNGGTT